MLYFSHGSMDLSQTFRFCMWVITHNISCEFYFLQLFINSSNVSIMNIRCLYLTLYLNRLFSMSVPSSCSNTRSKSVVNWYKLSYQWTREANHSVLQKKMVFYLGIMLASLGVCLIVFQHSTSRMLTHWQIYMVHFLLLLHQNCSLVTSSLRKLYF